MISSLKMLDAIEGRVGGYLIAWGSPRQRDLQGEYFTPQTDLGLDWYPQRPVLYHHGLDDTVGSAVIGVIDSLKADAQGLWAEARLNLRQRHAPSVLRLIERGELGWSSGSLPHLVEVAQDGRITRWIIVEGSLTPTPAEPRLTDVQALKSAYAALGLDATRLDPSPKHKRQGHTNMTPYNDTARRLPYSDREAREAPTAAQRITVTSQYDNLSALDMLHGYMMLRTGKHFQGASEHYANALAWKLEREGKLNKVPGIKAGELSISTQTGYGDEWVPNLWSAELWAKARAENVVLSALRPIEMPSNPYELPTEGADPTVYFVGETANESAMTFGSGAAIPSSRMGSGKAQLLAKKLALRVGFSAELAEDSLVPVLAMYREQAQKALSTSIDYVLLNGDVTATNANINRSGGSPSFDGNERFLAMDGLRKLPIVTNAANTVDAAGVVTLDKLRTTRFKMAADYAARPSDLAWFVDPGTYAKLLGLPEFLTMEKAGALATAQTGQIGIMDGAPVFVSPELPLTDTTGKVSTTVANNTRGTALCVYTPGWCVGYRRNIGIALEYVGYHDAYQLTASVRFALIRYNNQPAAALVNITL
jgi:HK97 family phage major capsid protein